MGHGSPQESGSNEKRSTEWTLTDEALRDGIQSTTRYRNKRTEGMRNRDRPYAAHSPSSYCPGRKGMATGGMAASRNGYGAYRVTKPRSGLRMAPRSGYIPRTSSPANVPFYHNTLGSQASSSAASIPGIKMEPHYLDGHSTPEDYGMIMCDGSGMMHHTPQSSFEAAGAETQNMFRTSAHPQQPLAPQQFSYGAGHDMHIGYHAPGEEAHVAMPVTTGNFDPTMTHAFCDWDPQAPRF